jgi:sRNA-binding carbon storage regulator CsrA
MLVLTRRIYQGVRVYDNDGRYMGRIVNLGVERDRVKLGFDVDARFTLIRDELLEEAPPAHSPECAVSNKPAALRSA